VVEALAPGGRVTQLLEVIAKYSKRSKHIALVGHEPDLGELAARLLRARGTIEFKKSAICCIELDGAMPTGPGTLKWLLPPRALRKIGR
jgi:phosphohistidine phosphatase